MDHFEWDAAVEALYASELDEARPAESIETMRRFLAGHPDAGPLAPFELAGVHDWLGLEAEAVPLYESALGAGLAEPHASRARIQLASSLRNLGRSDEAIALLGRDGAPELEGARRAFLALALHDAGSHAEALQEALVALVPTLPRYRRSLDAYAAALVDET